MAKKAAPKSAGAKTAAPKATGEKSGRLKSATKAEVYSGLAEKTGLSKKEVAGVFDALGDMIKKELANKKGAGQFVVPGLMKIKVVRKPATKEKQGINPFTKEPMTIKAKPARNALKALFLKNFKDSV